MEFMLVWEWIDEDTFELYEQRVDFFATKEDLLEAKKKAEEQFKWQIGIGRLILSPAIGYSWADLERLFQFFSLLDAESKKAPRPLSATADDFTFNYIRKKIFRTYEVIMKKPNPEILLDNGNNLQYNLFVS